MNTQNTRFRKLAIRRTFGSASECLCRTDSGLSATAFVSPAEAVLRASTLGCFAPDKTFLEIGSGNLRNALFVQKNYHPKKAIVVEQPHVVKRFADKYRIFQESHGEMRHALPRGKFDAIVITYVLETICPPLLRDRLLSEVVQRMHRESQLVLSIRGYGGVRGSQYKRCPHSDGSISSRGAFVRAYGLDELEHMLNGHNINFVPLKRYRVEKPENIHGIGKIRNN